MSDPVLPRAVGDPVAEDHRPRAGRRRCLRTRSARLERAHRARRGGTGGASGRSPSTRRGWRRKRLAADFSDIEELDRALRAAMYAAPDSRAALIRAHPDLGRRLSEHSKRAGQARPGPPLPADYERFTATNAAYKRKLRNPVRGLRARAHGSLANADARLRHTREQEIETALGEIAKIGRLRWMRCKL